MILVTGSSGTIGRALLDELTSSGHRVRAAYRSRRPALPGVEPVQIDLNTGEGLDAAISGADAVFLLVGEVPDQVAAERRVVEAAKRAGTRRLVKLSVLAAESEGFTFARTHRAVERAIEGSGIPYTFLRPGSFMQNFVTYYRDMIRGQGEIYLPMGDAREALVDTRDIARVAARALTSAGHEGKAYDLLGPEPLSYGDAANKISMVAGRPITYVNVTDEQFKAATLASGAPEAYAEALLDLCQFIRKGQMPKRSTAIKDVTGRDPTSFDQFAHDYADAWKA